jgi:hypothetical protein
MEMEMISMSSQRSSITARAIQVSINQHSREQESPHSKIGCRHGAIVLNTTHIDCFLGPPFVDPRVWCQRGTDVWVVSL